MKLVIDIPDKDYEFIRDLQSLIIGGRGNCKTIQYNVINAIKNGTPYKVAYDDVIAISFSADIDEPNKVQTKDGNWHNGVIIDPPKG